MKAINGFKQCCRCKLLKSTREFGLLNSASDGLQYHCKECKNTAQRKYRRLRWKTDSKFRITTMGNTRRYYLKKTGRTTTRPRANLKHLSPEEKMAHHRQRNRDRNRDRYQT